MKLSPPPGAKVHEKQNLQTQGRMQILETNEPEGFKTCFDTAKSKISTNAAIPAKKYGFTKQKHIRGDKTLNKYNFGPNVI